MNKKKIGLLALALVLALGALGIGYATWTDQITVHGTVETGSVDIEAEYFSGTIIYKDLTDDSLQTYFWVEDAEGNLKYSSGTAYDDGNVNHVLVSQAYAEPGTGYDVEITATGAFPSDVLCADCIIHCVGTVPVIVTYDIDSSSDILNWLWEKHYAYFEAEWVDFTDPNPGNPGLFTSYTECGEAVEPIQMHNCDYVKFWLYLDLPQDDELEGEQWSTGYPVTEEDFMNLTDLEFTATFDAVQWNAYAGGGTPQSNPCQD